MPVLAEYLLLILVANASPVIVREFFSLKRETKAIDNNAKFFDGQPVFGPAKTWRGLISAVLLCGAFALILKLSVFDGLMIGLLAMLGDLIGSFIKRRIHYTSDQNLPGIDQVPEALLPLTYGVLNGHLDIYMLITGLLIFTGLALVLSLLLYQLGIRRK